MLLKRIKEVVDKEGTLHALRRGFDIHGGGHFDLCYLEPTNPVAEESRRLYEENLLHVQRQLKFSETDEKSLDMVLFLNGLPIFTVELKNQISGQNVEHAMKQYRDTRDPKEPLFRFKRCVAHFAVDNALVYVATELANAKTLFLPFNQGADGGAGNPPCQTGYATGYLWREIWRKPRILDLIQRFIRVVDVLDNKGKKNGKQRQIFPRFHQLSCVRELGADAQKHGAGRRYLNQHSAGSGKTNCIAWLANSLATLHAPDGKPVFSSVIVISDRRVIDRQLQRTLTRVIETKGMLVNIAADEGMTSRDLKTALEDGKRIIVTTLQKFGVILDSMGQLPGERFAVHVDEAHSSQAGESAKAVQKVLSYASEDEQKDEEEKTTEDRILEELKTRGPQKNVSYFAFTATPKPETLQQFGTRHPDGSFRPYSLYTMRQAIEEGFILDVLRNYTTYDQYWALLKKVEDDPAFDGTKAKSLLRQFVSRHERTIAKKVARKSLSCGWWRESSGMGTRSRRKKPQPRQRVSRLACRLDAEASARGRREPPLGWPAPGTQRPEAKDSKSGQVRAVLCSVLSLSKSQMANKVSMRPSGTTPKRMSSTSSNARCRDAISCCRPSWRPSWRKRSASVMASSVRFLDSCCTTFARKTSVSTLALST